jgi:hypothetical protein
VAIPTVAGRPGAGPVTARLVLVDADAPQVDVAEVASTTKSLTLAPAATKTVKLPAPVMPLVAAGDYLLVARVVTPDGSPSDAAGVPVSATAAYVDLAGVGIEPTLAPGVARRNEKVKLVVENRGNVPVSGPVDVLLAASVDNAFSEDDAVLVRTPANLRLAPGRTTTLRFNVAFPPNLPPGFYSLVAVINPDNVLGEDDATRGDNVVIGRQSIRAS